MNSISEAEWQLLRRIYGDLAYEHPDMHIALLQILRRPRLVVNNTSKKKPA